MATTFLTMQDEALGFVGITQGAGVSALRTKVKRFLNRAGRDFWGRYPWKERKATGTVLTAEPYSTGTFAVTQGSAAVTGSGTTWVAAHTGMKFAKSISSPYYTFTRTGATTGTLDRNYAETTETAGAYILYQDVYALSTSAESLLSQEFVIHRDGAGAANTILRAESEELWSFPRGSGTPLWWALHDVSAGAMRVRFGPYVPDTTFWVRYGYLALYTEMSADGDECVVPERWRHVIIHGALRELFLALNDPERAMMWGRMFEEGIARAWLQYTASEPLVTQMHSWDEGRPGNTHTFTIVS